MADRQRENTGPLDNPVVPQAEAFYPSALRRIQVFMIAVAILTATLGARFVGRASALGFICGCFVAGLNFYWLKSGVNAFAEKATANPADDASPRPSARRILLRFLARYVLMAAVAYVILNSYPAGLRGFFVGLLLPVAAIACELVYEVYTELYLRVWRVGR